ncbi:hydrogenase maturation nickel metallochaperone HypA/HybF [Pararhodonellum marinum]|uniref:hydrogenase maturation nickel metallochaperone HypA/HybF n=1 Tax=Pararhodonellum marinum TaxID=2755358 RepID=UPI00189072AF|nr:hydrogenase maturation nickel metallochaperone HypA [Pararhodonellum marinum]
MHEISLVKNIFGSLDSIYPEKDRGKIKKIYMKVGLLSNVEPILMQNAFEAVVATERKEYSSCELQIEVLPILVYCEDCLKESEVLNYRFVCACNKPTNNIIQGNELLISGVEFME